MDNARQIEVKTDNPFVARKSYFRIIKAKPKTQNEKNDEPSTSQALPPSEPEPIPVEDEIVCSQTDFQLETIHTPHHKTNRPRATHRPKPKTPKKQKQQPKPSPNANRQLPIVLRTEVKDIFDDVVNARKRKGEEETHQNKKTRFAVSTAPSSPIASGLSTSTPSLSPPSIGSPPSTPPPDIQMDLRSLSGFKFNRMHEERYNRFRIISVVPECPSFQDIVALVQLRRFQRSSAKERLVTVVASKEHSNSDATHKHVILRGSWVSMTPLQKYDIIHVIGEFYRDTETGIETCIIDDKSGYIITNPDHLVSATDASACNPCIRKIFLRNKVEYKNIRRNTDKLNKMGCSSVNSTQVYGTMLHEIFQACLDENSFTIDSMRHHAEDALQKQFVILTVLNISEDKAREELATYFDGFIQWASTYLGRSSPGNRVKFYGSENGSVVKVTKLHALEESVWSPMYGLKGYIDLSVEVSVTNGTTTNDQIIPIELKSGKCDPKFSPKGKMDHRAQVLMYLLMMSDKYDRDITNGMLYYFKESQVFGVDKVQNEVRAILQMRNLLASSLINAKITYNKSQQSGSLDVASNSSQQAKSNSIERDVEDLLFEVKYLTPEPPPTIQDARECKRCYMLNTCALYNRVFESPEPNKLGEEFEERTGHVTNIHAEYMKKWITCLDLESLEMNHFRKEMWSMTGPEREKVGRCISCMVVVDEGAMSVGVYHYRMRRHADGPNTSLKSIGIDIDSYVTISTEVGHISVSSGYITEMTDTEIVVKLKRELKAEGELEECLYRVDLDEYEIQYKHQRGIVLSLFDHEPINDNVINLRELVAEERRPRFKTEKTIPDLEKIKQYQWYKQELNSDQTDAIERVLRAEDYSLILGMPGTGKTTTIVYVVKSLLELGKKVLVTAHTHTAVDNMLLKLKSIGVSEFVRIGRKKDVHVQLHDSLVDSNTNECSDGRIDTTEKLEKLLLNKKLFGATCLATDPLLQVQDFDYCIVDEASQITHTECVGPLFYAKKFVLVGDHNQLPPLVKNNVAREMGMGESLFKVLSNKHGDIAMTVLSYQYRMNEQVLTLCNKLVYGDALKCGNEQVANGKLQLPNDDTTERTWLDEIISPEQPVMFINTDTLDYGRENRLGHKVFNDFEADLLCEIVSALLARGCDAKAIGVMSPFRSQVTMIRTKLRSSSGVMCNTIDKFQGLDNDVTIMSLVRSNEQKEINELLKERSRLNVALTRARHKLIIIGSLDTFKIHEPYCTLLTFMLEKGWIYDMPNVPSITDVASIGLMQQTSEETGEDEVMVDEEKSTPIRTISQAMFGDVFDVEVKPTHKVSVNPFIKNLKIASQVRQTKQTTTSTQNSLLFTMVSFNSPLNVL